MTRRLATSGALPTRRDVYLDTIEDRLAATYLRLRLDQLPIDGVVRLWLTWLTIVALTRGGPMAESRRERFRQLAGATLAGVAAMQIMSIAVPIIRNV